MKFSPVSVSALIVAAATTPSLVAGVPPANPCASSPCLVGQVCQAHGNSYSCLCPDFSPVGDDGTCTFCQSNPGICFGTGGTCVGDQTCLCLDETTVFPGGYCPAPTPAPDMDGYTTVYHLSDETDLVDRQPLTSCPPKPDLSQPNPQTLVGTGTIQCDADFFCYQLQQVWQLEDSSTFRYTYKFMDCQAATGGQTSSFLGDHDLSHWHVAVHESCSVTEVEGGCLPGTPEVGENNPHCTVPYGWTGSTHFVSKCDEIPGNTNEGTMTFEVDNVQDPLDGFSSQLFSKSSDDAATPPATLAGPVCIEDPCHPDPCGGNGVCEVIEDAPYFQCTCPCTPDVTLEPGVSCITCENGGTVVAGKCVCPVEFLGDFCEIPNPCVPNNPCQNEGTCSPINGGTSYVCACPDGFTGFQCQFDSTTACETLRRLVRRRLLGPNKA